MGNYWQTEHTAVYSCLTITALLFIIVLSIFLYITYEPRKDLAILPDPPQKKKKKVFPRTEKSAVFVPRWRLGSVCLEHCVERDSEALYHSSQGKEGTDGLISGGAGCSTGWSGCHSSHFCFRQSTVGEEWQVNWALYLVHQSLIKCSLPWRFFDSPLKRFFPKWWERATFFIWIRNENVPKKRNLGFGAGLWLSQVLIILTQFLLQLGALLALPKQSVLQDVTWAKCVSCRFSPHLGVSHLRTLAVHRES